MNSDTYPLLKNLPGGEREEFTEWLRGQTIPLVKQADGTEEVGYYTGDYERWKAGLPVSEIDQH